MPGYVHEDVFQGGRPHHGLLAQLREVGGRFLLTLEEPGCRLAVALDILDDDESRTLFFERQEDAAAHLARLDEKAVVRPSTLEDVFVHVTGNRARFDNGGETCDR